MWPVVLSLLLVLAAFLVVYCRKRYRFFTERGVETLKPLPFIGSFWKGAIYKKHFLDDFRDGYNTYPNEKYVGFFEGFSPVILIRDPELVKKVTIKDFDHFIDRRNIVFKDHDPIVMNSLQFLKGQKWKEMRGTLSPAFTGSKMRMMLPFMEDISSQVIQYLHEEVDSGGSQTTAPKELYDLFTRYANDVIASCAFGIKVDSFKDKNNEFYSMGRVLTKLKLFKFLLIVLFPRIAMMANVKMFLPKATKFFRDLACETMRYREDNHVIRPDMIQLLLEAKNGTLKKTASKADKDSLGFATVEESVIYDDLDVNKKWSDVELAAQVFQFFVAGFDMVASALTFTAHELAINPHVQARLYAEMRDRRAHGDPLSYEALQGLRYLDMVVSEGLRKWGTAVILERECIKEYVLEPPHSGGKPVTMKPKDYFYILVNAMHMDPQYFPDPHKFDPERFSDERKHEIKPFTYLPFGSGPRNCIGSRFALMEVKVMLYQLLLEFELVACEKTSDPIRLGFDVKIVAAGGSWIQFKPRK